MDILKGNNTHLMTNTRDILFIYIEITSQKRPLTIHLLLFLQRQERRIGSLCKKKSLYNLPLITFHFPFSYSRARAILVILKREISSFQNYSLITLDLSLPLSLDLRIWNEQTKFSSTLINAAKMKI